RNAMGVCHTIDDIDGVFAGNELDLEMFNASGLKMAKEGNELSVKTEDGSLGFVRRLGFSTALRRSSVVVRAAAGLFVYLKGSPDDIVEVFDASTVPDDYAEQLTQYTLAGNRVIACAFKRLDCGEDEVEHLSRDKIEGGVCFCGFVCLENKLKEKTIQVFRELSHAEIGFLMCTGDNPLTAFSIAKKCEMVPENTRQYISHIVAKENRVEWLCREDKHVLSETEIMDPLFFSEKTALVCTGAAFEVLEKSEKTLLKERILVKTKIYARMLPHHKKLLVEQLQKLDYSVCFCGDGTNDLKAINTADVGLSLSKDNSAGASFVSENGDVGSASVLLKEGRGFLTTTVLSIVFFILTTIIQVAFVSLMLFSGISPPNPQYLIYDLVITFAVSLTMTSFKTTKRLTRQKPISSLFCLKFLLRLGTHSVLFLAAMLGFFFGSLKRDDENKTVIKNGPTFVLGLFQHILAALISCYGHPFKKNGNKFFFFYLALIAGFGVSLVFFYMTELDLSLLKSLKKHIKEELVSDETLTWFWWGVSFGVSGLNVFLVFVSEFFLIPKAILWRERGCAIKTGRKKHERIKRGEEKETV
ncbi:MAG: P-type ATPase, partial [Amphiamblys sp. WSBS2006]